MEVRFLLSGETLAVLDPNEFEGKSAMAMKQSLAPQVGVSRFRQRLFREDGSEIQDDEILETVPAKVQLVVLEFCPPDDKQILQMRQACINNDLIDLKELLQRALQPNVADQWSATPLHYAARLGHLECVLLLLEAGADKEQAKNDDGATPLFLAAHSGHLDIVRCLSEVGAQKNQAKNNGATPMYIAARNGHLDVVRYLTESGAQKEQATHDGATPLFIAAQKGHLDIVRYLSESGAQKDQALNDGRTPLFIAAQQGHLDVVRYLTEVGANTDRVTNDGSNVGCT